MAQDQSNGYEAIADDYMAARSDIGRDIVAAWAAKIPTGGSVLDIGAASGERLTGLLVEAGLDVFAIDASPTMVAAFEERFPDVPIACEPAEDSAFFDRAFDAVMAIGLVFLLSEDAQRKLLNRIAEALKPRGTFLFSAPWQECSWRDVLTGQLSRSLGVDAYRQILSGLDMDAITTHTDDGQNHYFESRKNDY